MKDLSHLKYFLGIEVARSGEDIYLSQRKYCLDIISECGLTGSSPVSTPMVENHKLVPDEGPMYGDVSRYRRLVGRLVYLALKRPELSYCAHILAQFMQAPRKAHWDAALRVVKYLKGSSGQGILLTANNDLHITAYSDAHWSTCPLTRKSLSSYVVLLGDSAISWKTKKQKRVSFSSAEAEYCAMTLATKQLLWLKKLLQSLGIVHKDSMKLVCDSKAALHIVSNSIFHERTKHILSVIVILYVMRSHQEILQLCMFEQQNNWQTYLLKRLEDNSSLTYLAS